MKNSIQRKPIVAALLSLILGPIIGMCYLNKGKYALIYLAVAAALVFLIIACTHGLVVENIVMSVFAIIGSLHSFLIAKKHPVIELPKWYMRWWLWILFAVISILVCIRVFLYEPFHIPSASMCPNIIPGDYLFAEKFAYNNSSPQRGDIIIFKLPSVTISTISNV